MSIPEISPIVRPDLAVVIDALGFAARKHRDQRRKDHAASPWHAWVGFRRRAAALSGTALTRPDDRFAYGEVRFSAVGLLRLDLVVIAHTETECGE